MRRSRRSTETETAELNITSAIDVVFLLLIFFIIQMLQIDWPEDEANIRAYLPKQEDKGVTDTPEVEERTEVQIGLKKGLGNHVRIFFNGKERNGYSDLKSAMFLLKTSAPDSKVILSVERAVPVFHVVRTLDICAGYGFKDVSFAMQKKEA